jgi:hypothetical protein
MQAYPRRHFGIFFVTLSCCMLVWGGEPAPGTPPPNAQSGLFASSMLATQRLNKPIALDTGPAVVKGGILELRGVIDAAMRERFEQAVVAGKVTTIRITSQGGGFLDALQMAAVIQARGIDVVVRDFCTGACANYIFVAGRKRRLERRSLVGFMTTLKSNGTMLVKAIETLEMDNPVQQAMGQLSSVEEQLYRQRGVSPALLLDPHIAMQPICAIVRRQGAGLTWNMTTQYIMWVPGRAYLKAAGVEFEGDWPRSQSSLGSLSNYHLKTGNSRWIRYADDDPLRPKKQRPYRLEDLTQCVLDELPNESPQ